MDSFIETLKRLGVMRLAIMGSILAALLGFFFMITDRISEPDMDLLYSDLDMGDGAQIVSRLEEMGIPVELKGGGTQIFVPSDQVARLRMSMAEAGLPGGGSLGYEIFDKTDVLGATSFVQDINRLRALEGELTRSIKSINNVASARVHLVIPKRELFVREAQQPSASIILKMRGTRLNAAQVQGIQHLVAAAVPGLGVDKISIIDERGTLLARGDDGEEGVIFGLEERKLNMESRLARTIEMLVERSVGPGKVRAEVTVDIERDGFTENAEVYDPAGQVLRSSQTSEETGDSSDAKSSSASTVKNNIPNAGAGGAGGNQSTNKTSRTDETMNYDVSRTIKTKVHQAGGIQKLSAAVLVDGTYGPAQGDKPGAYTPRPPEEMKKLETLIKTAIGFDEKRGDKVEIINMQFAAEPVVPASDTTDYFMGFARHEVIRMAETLVLSIVSLLALLLVVKPMVNRLLSGAGTRQSADGIERAPDGSVIPMARDGGAGNQGTLSGPGQAQLPGNSNAGSLPAPNGGVEETMAIDNILGRVKVSSVKKVEEIVDNRTDEVVNQVRSWMREGEAA